MNGNYFTVIPAAILKEYELAFLRRNDTSKTFEAKELSNLLIRFYEDALNEKNETLLKDLNRSKEGKGLGFSEKNIRKAWKDPDVYNEFGASKNLRRTLSLFLLDESWFNTIKRHSVTEESLFNNYNELKNKGKSVNTEIYQPISQIDLLNPDKKPRIDSKAFFKERRKLLTRLNKNQLHLLQDKYNVSYQKKASKKDLIENILLKGNNELFDLLDSVTFEDLLGSLKVNNVEQRFSLKKTLLIVLSSAALALLIIFGINKPPFFKGFSKPKSPIKMVSERVESKKFKILILPIERDSNCKSVEHKTEYEKILLSSYRETKLKEELDITIDTLFNVPTAIGPKQVVSIASQNNATFLIWGNYTETCNNHKTDNIERKIRLKFAICVPYTGSEGQKVIASFFGGEDTLSVLNSLNDLRTGLFQPDIVDMINDYKMSSYFFNGEYDKVLNYSQYLGPCFGTSLSLDIYLKTLIQLNKYEKVIEIDEDCFDYDEHYFQKSLALINSNRDDEAIEKIDNITNDFDRLAFPKEDYLSVKALLHFKNDNFIEMNKTADQILNLKPNNIKGLEFKARYHASKQECIPLNRTCTDILVIDSTNILSNYFLGLHYSGNSVCSKQINSFNVINEEESRDSVTFRKEKAKNLLNNLFVNIETNFLSTNETLGTEIERMYYDAKLIMSFILIDLCVYNSECGREAFERVKSYMEDYKLAKGEDEHYKELYDLFYEPLVNLYFKNKGIIKFKN